MSQPRRRLVLGPAVAVALAAGILVTAPTSGAQVTAVRGSAFGVSAPNISIFASPQKPYGPRPAVSLPAGGSVNPIIASDPTESVVYGPATLWSAGKTVASTKGTPAGQSVTSSVSVAAATQPAGTCPGTSTSCIYGGPFTATALSDSCSANGRNTASLTVTGGTVVTGTDTSGNPTTTVAVPVHPGVNDRIPGFLYVSPTDKETFVWVFNWQQTNADGSITAILAEEILQGPTAKGNIYVGQVTCGLTGTVVTTTTL